VRQMRCRFAGTASRSPRAESSDPIGGEGGVRSPAALAAGPPLRRPQAQIHFTTAHGRSHRRSPLEL
ncbi:hypothetical protein HPP92_029104, partial [Vanilla planifolia]